MNVKKSIFQTAISVILLIAMVFQIFSIVGVSQAAEYREKFIIAGQENGEHYKTSNMTFKNGFSQKAHNRWIFYRLGGSDTDTPAVYDAIYCIHPGKATGTGAKYIIDSNDSYLKGITNSLTTAEEKKNLISLVLSKGEQRSYSRGVYTDGESWAVYGGKYIATQVLIWEIVTEDRDANFNLINTSSNAVANIKNGFTSTGKSYFSTYYNQYEKAVLDALKKASLPNEVELKYDGTQYTATITDSKLSQCKVKSTPAGVTATISGNNLVITSKNPINSTDKIVVSQYIPCGNADFYKGNGEERQELVKPSTKTLNAEKYQFKILPKTTQLGKIEINKVSANPSFTSGNSNYSLQGAKFKVTGNGKSLEVITDANGFAATSSTLPFGEYTIEEIVAPKGYVLNSTKQKVKIDANTPIVNSISVASTNINETPKGGYIKIFKRDSVTNSSAQGNATLKGGVFEVYNSKNELVTTVDCGNATYGVTGLLPLGIYTVKEVKAPSGYKINDTVFTVTINEPTGATVTVEQIIKDEIIKGSVTITKYKTSIGADGNLTEKTPFEGIVFKLKSKTTGVEYTSKETATDKEGKVIFENLPYDTYEIIETVPQGYKTPATKTVTITENKNYDIEIINEVKTDLLTIQKTTNDNINIANIGFTITGKSIDEKDFTITIYTDENGIAKATIPYGDYVITENECEANKYYVIPSEKTINFGSAKTIEFFNETQVGNLSVDKYIQDTNLEYIAGKDITFNLNGTSYAGYTIDKFITTNGEGKAVFENIPVGEYKLTEVADANNQKYILNKAIEVAVAHNTTSSTAVYNDLKTAVVNLNKYQKGSNEEIVVADAEYTLFTSDGTVFATAKTDKEGKIKFEKIPYGEYILKESLAPFGYAINTDEIPISITEDGQVFNFDVEDELLLRNINIQKQCRDTGNFLANTEFTLFDVDTNEKIDTVVTDSNGFATFFDVAYGNYVIKETKAPEGYANDSEPIAINLDGEFNAEERFGFTDSPIPQTGIELSNSILLLILTFLLFLLSVACNDLWKIRKIKNN